MERKEWTKQTNTTIKTEGKKLFGRPNSTNSAQYIYLIGSIEISVLHPELTWMVSVASDVSVPGLEGGALPIDINDHIHSSRSSWQIAL